MRISALQGGWNLNWFRLVPASAGNNGPSTFALTLQGEDYEWMSGVRTQPTTDAGGGLNVGWIDPGDWMSYREVNLPEDGLYTVEYRVASLHGGGSFQLERAGGYPVYDRVSVPRTGGWQNWTTVRHQVRLPAGRIRFGIGVQSGGWNLNWIRITK